MYGARLDELYHIVKSLKEWITKPSETSGIKEKKTHFIPSAQEFGEKLQHL